MNFCCFHILFSGVYFLGLSLLILHPIFCSLIQKSLEHSSPSWSDPIDLFLYCGTLSNHFIGIALQSRIESLIPRLTYSTARLIITSPKELFSVDRCDVDLIPTGPQNFSAIHGTLRYFETLNNGSCDGGTFTHHTNSGRNSSDNSVDSEDPIWFWRPIWNSARNLLVPPASSSRFHPRDTADSTQPQPNNDDLFSASSFMHDELRSFLTPHFLTMGFSPRTRMKQARIKQLEESDYSNKIETMGLSIDTHEYVNRPESYNDFTKRIMLESDQATDYIDDEIWIFDKCNSSIHRIIEEGNLNAKAILFFDADFSKFPDLITPVKDPSIPNIVPKIPLGSIDSASSPLPADLKLVLRSPEFFNNSSIQVVFDPEPNFSCTSVQPIMIASLCFVPLWWTVALFWGYYIFIYHSPSRSSPLDRMFLSIPGLRSMICICTFLCWNICPDFRSFIFQYLLMSYMGLTTVFFTCFFTVLLLAAKGFTITRTTLTRRESIVVVILATLVYVIVSINQVGTYITFPSLLFLYLVLLITTWKSSTYNIDFINSRLEYIEWQQQIQREIQGGFAVEARTTTSLSHEPFSELVLLQQSTSPLTTQPPPLSESLPSPRNPRNSPEHSTDSPTNTHFTEFFNALSTKVEAFEHIRQLITFYFFNEIVTVRLLLVYVIDSPTAAAVTQMIVELMTFMWLCFAFRSRSTAHSSAATELLQQATRTPPPILPLYVLIDQPASPFRSSTPSAPTAATKRSCGRGINYWADCLKSIQSLNSRKSNSERQDGSLIVVVHPNGLSEIGIECQLEPYHSQQYGNDDRVDSSSNEGMRERIYSGIQYLRRLRGLLSCAILNRHPYRNQRGRRESELSLAIGVGSPTLNPLIPQVEPLDV